MILAGDIGGTTTRLGIFSKIKGPLAPVAKKDYPSQKYACIEDIVNTFLAEQKQQGSRACFGVAGPVKDNTATITNLPWTIQTQTLQLKTALEDIALLNDLEAMGYAIPTLDKASLVTIHDGIPEKNGVKALIAPGTGLGEVFLIWDGKKYRAHRSEGGHTEFAPRNDMQAALLTYLRKKYDHVSYERVCSGMGLPNLYNFYRDSGKFDEPVALAAAMQGVEDVTPIIVDAAIREPEKNPICVAVVDLFTSILAAQAGNLALTVSCYGGIYIGGGIPPRISKFINRRQFVAAFQDKGRLTPMMSNIPIHLINQPDIAIIGAACHGLYLNPSNGT